MNFYPNLFFGSSALTPEPRSPCCCPSSPALQNTSYSFACLLQQSSGFFCPSTGPCALPTLDSPTNSPAILPSCSRGVNLILPAEGGPGPLPSSPSFRPFRISNLNLFLYTVSDKKHRPLATKAKKSQKRRGAASGGGEATDDEECNQR